MSDKVYQGQGAICKKCKTQMDRYGHPPHYIPDPTKDYYYAYWDCCPRCFRLWHYNDAKRSTKVQPVRHVPVDQYQPESNFKHGNIPFDPPYSKDPRPRH